MAEDLGWVPPGVDTEQPSIARTYDYWLGGTHNFRADQDAARTVIAMEPSMRTVMRANRDFLTRAVRCMAEAGIRQFLDIGSGIPTQGNVHEVAQDAVPGARVVYVDVDPVAVAHSQAILLDNPDAGVIQADLRDPEKILGHPVTQRLLDFSQPTGLLLLAVLHFVSDSEDPHGIVGTLRAALAPGSYLALSHASTHGVSAERAAVMQSGYRQSVSQRGTMRDLAGVERFFDGFEVLPPGVVPVADWRHEHTNAEASGVWWIGGVGRKS